MLRPHPGCRPAMLKYWPTQPGNLEFGFQVGVGQLATDQVPSSLRIVFAQRGDGDMEIDRIGLGLGIEECQTFGCQRATGGERADEQFRTEPARVECSTPSECFQSPRGVRGRILPQPLNDAGDPQVARAGAIPQRRFIQLIERLRFTQPPGQLGMIYSVNASRQRYQMFEQDSNHRAWGWRVLRGRRSCTTRSHLVSLRVASARGNDKRGNANEPGPTMGPVNRRPIRWPGETAAIHTRRTGVGVSSSPPISANVASTANFNSGGRIIFALANRQIWRNT